MENKGFSLIEVVVAVAIMGIVSTAIMSLYIQNTQTYTMQTDVVQTQQNLRAVLRYMRSHIRMAGYNPPTSNVTLGGPISTGNKVSGDVFTICTTGALEFGMDYNPNDKNDTDDGTISAAETFKFSLADDDNQDGLPNDDGDAYSSNVSDLVQDDNTDLAEDIQALAFSYAIDADNDLAGRLDSYNVSGTEKIMWAVPRGNQWVNLDTNSDGVLTVDDDTDGDGQIDGVNTGITVRMNHVKAVKVDILARSSHVDRNYSDGNSYIVGPHIILGNNEPFRRRLLSSIVRCRNL